jgi:transcriptional regulator with XRE-family HTH domain
VIRVTAIALPEIHNAVDLSTLGQKKFYYTLFGVPKPSGRMNDWERYICAQFKLVRESLHWSQSEFSKELGITRDQLTAIESGSTPLRYDIAWRLRIRFTISLRWLAEEEGFPGSFLDDDLPPPSKTGLSGRALLSSVIKARDKRVQREAGASPISTPEQLSASLGAIIYGKEEQEADIKHRLVMEDFIKIWVPDWIARAPLGKANELTEFIMKSANDFLRRFPEDPAKVVDARAEEMTWERIRSENAKRRLSGLENNPLTQTSESSRNAAVKTKLTLKELLKMVKLVTEPRGMKAKLAKHLGVSESNVSEWLRGIREPGGEMTLRLLNWVNDPKR